MLPIRSMVWRYVKEAATVEEVETWCRERGLVPLALERGPDRMVRGIAVQAADLSAAGRLLIDQS